MFMKPHSIPAGFLPIQDAEDMEMALPWPWKTDRCVVVAEIGINHNRDPELAAEMIDAAAEAGADAVKFQTFVPEESAADDAPLTEDQKGRVQGSMLEMVRSFCLDPVHWPMLRTRAESCGVEFFSTPFDIPSLDRLVRLGVRVIKVPSGEIVNLPLLRAIAGTGLPVVMSTGMCELAEVGRAVRELEAADGGPIALLHCTSAYPARANELNLRAMGTLASTFGLPVGFSDHSVGCEAAIAAVALGARIVEKHFTLDKSLPGPDHPASATPEEFADLVRAIRRTESALGTGEKKPVERELAVRAVVRRSLFFRRPLACGTRITPDDLVAMRPGGGFSVERIDEVIGKTLLVDVGAHEALAPEKVGI